MRNLIQAFIAGIAGAVTVVVLIGATSIKTDGSIETDQQLVSNVQRGTPPLAVQSSTVVPNLNADSVDGYGANAFAVVSNTYTMAEVDALLATYRDSRRAFYLTTTVFDGDQADGTGVCDAGFHFASLFEILDVTSLRYDTGRGVTIDDAGQGPPARVWGWVRTGSFADGGQIDVGSRGDGGLKNCNAWTTAAADRDGTRVTLTPCWQEVADCPAEYGYGLTHWWAADDLFCSAALKVWCVEDYPGAAAS